MKKIVLITGASGGIGAAVAKLFSQNGYAVVLQYRSHPSRVEETAKSFSQDTPYLCVYCDLLDPDSIDEMIRTIHQRLGSVSVLVNCAGIALEQKLFTETDDTDFTRVFETNVNGMMRVTRALSNDLRANRGAVVNLSSVWGVAGGACEVLYSASKAAVIGFTKALAKELAPSGVNVNCVAPGWIRTEMNAHLSEQDMELFIKDTALGRIGTAEDVANAVLYLAEADYVTGQVLCCDGGYNI